jgi:exodeoxyribonuclease V
MAIELSPDQASAMDAILAWYRYDADKPLTLGGYAGTGKTTLLGQLKSCFPSSAHIHYASYTGKAASVLKGKLPAGSEVTTLHRLLYHPRQVRVCKVSKEPCVSGFHCSTHTPETPFLELPEPCETVKQLDWSQRDNPLHGIDLVVVDEASMISDKIWVDLTKWGVPVLAVGDHGQLPPVKSNFNLMDNPHIKLETILRQAQGSPIIRMATIAREYGEIAYRDFGQGCVHVTRSKMSQYPMDPDDGDIIICGYNRTRNDLNDSMRNLLDRNGPPQKGDIVICLRNSYENGTFNGMRGRVKEFEPSPTDSAFAVIEMLDEGFDFAGQVDPAQFGKAKTDNSVPRYLGLFDYGYAITCHKAQGSQADRVMVINEKLPQTDHRRWLYTAVTRAAKELIVVG